MEVYLNLPDDALYHVCEKMDNITLSNTVKSHGRFYQVCSNILHKRRIYETVELFNFLLGTWIKCIDDVMYGTNLLKIKIIREDNRIIVQDKINLFHKPILDDMMPLKLIKNIRDVEVYADFSIADTVKLQILFDKLISRGFRNIPEDGIFAIRSWDEPSLIYFYLPEKLDNILGSHNPDDLFEEWDDDAQEYLFQTFGIEPVSDFDTRYDLLINKLEKQGRIFQCV